MEKGTDSTLRSQENWLYSVLEFQNTIKSGFMVALPADIAIALKLKDDERVKVLFDGEKKRVIYQF